MTPLSTVHWVQALRPISRTDMSLGPILWQIYPPKSPALHATDALALSGQYLVRNRGSSPGPVSNKELLANRSMRLVNG